jgi:hypothetical protein
MSQQTRPFDPFNECQRLRDRVKELERQLALEKLESASFQHGIRLHEKRIAELDRRLAQSYIACNNSDIERDALKRQLEAAQQQVAATAQEIRNAVLEEAAKWIDTRREDFMNEHGYQDPETGTWEYGRGPHAEAKLEYETELAEIADGIRALKVAAPAQQVQAPITAGNFCDSSNEQLNKQIASLPLPVFHQASQPQDSVTVQTWSAEEIKDAYLRAADRRVKEWSDVPDMCEMYKSDAMSGLGMLINALDELAALKPSSAQAEQSKNAVPNEQFAIVMDRSYDGEGLSLAVHDGINYAFSDGDCYNREGDTLDGYTAEFLTLHQLEKRMDEQSKDAARFAWYFSFEPIKDPSFLNVYMDGMNQRWNLQQWRAAIDAAMANSDKVQG